MSYSCKRSKLELMDLLDGCIKQMQLFESLLLANALEVNDAQLATNVRKSITGLARLVDTVQYCRTIEIIQPVRPPRPR